MHRASGLVLLLCCVAVGCNDASLVTATPSADGPITADAGHATAHDDAGVSDSGRPTTSNANLRVVAANISSGPSSTYDPDESIRLLQGLHPDLALVQELKYGDNTDADLKAFVAKAFGSEFTYFRESGVSIPNGIVSRYPIVTSGRWKDPQVGDRGFVYAKIAVPGSTPLWAVSVHLLTTSAGNRNSEAAALVQELAGVVASGDHVVIGGDLNTASRNESCLTTLAGVVETSGPYPADQEGITFTNAQRNRPYDWVLASKSLGAHRVPTVIGQTSLEAGLVFDSRKFRPLEDVAPIARSDSDALNMQHMPVVKDFALEP